MTMKTCNTCGETKHESYFRYQQCKACRNQKIMAWRALNPDKCKATKQKYYGSEKGKAQKQKEEAAYIASGKRALNEARRASKPISEARKAVRLKYQLMRSSDERALDEFDAFALSEAVSLRKLRETVLGGKWHVDHVFPVSLGGRSTHDNIQVVPAKWNRQKSNAHTERFFSAKE